MSAVPPFPEGQIEALARLLGECGSGTDISRVLQDRNLADNSGESTKWRRLYWVFLDSQRRSGCANTIVDFVQSFLVPMRFVGRSQQFEERRQELNTILGGGRRGPQVLGDILPIVLARLGVGRVESTRSGEADPS